MPLPARDRRENAITSRVRFPLADCDFPLETVCVSRGRDRSILSEAGREERRSVN